MSKKKSIKWNIKKAKKLFKDNGCKLLEEVYINCKTKMRYICSCEYKTEAKISLSSFRQGSRCMKCGIKRRAAKNRYTLKEVKKIFREEGCELLEIIYKNGNTKMKYICSCKFKTESETTLAHFMGGGRCKKCASKRGAEKRRYSYKEVKEIFRKGGCVLISKEYKSSKDKLQYLCNCKRPAEIKLNHFQEGSRCMKCAIERKSGKNHYRYNPSLTDEDRENRRTKPEDIKWRKSVFERDNYICQISGEKGYLIAHHLESYDINIELRTVVSNGIILGKELHTLFHKIYGYGKNTTAQFREFQKNYQQNLLNIEV